MEKIIPPRLEDAGLEDCALSPNSIREAFFKAASSIFSPPSDDCIDDPTSDDPSDFLKGISDGLGIDEGPCSGEKRSGLPEVMGDEVGAGGITGAEERVDKIVGAEMKDEERKKGCVEDALEGLKLKNDGENEEEEEEEEKKKQQSVPVLAEGFA